MYRLLGLAIGLCTIVAPDRFVASAERVAFENPDAGRLRSQTLPIARLKGLLVCVAIWRRWRVGSARTPLAALGVVLALVPRTALDAGLTLAYENPADLAVKPWVVPAARLLGAWYLTVGLFARRAGGSIDTSEGSDEPAHA